MPLREDPTKSFAGLPSDWIYLKHVPGLPFVSVLGDWFERRRTLREPRVIEIFDLRPTPASESEHSPSTIYVSHLHKNGQYIGAQYWTSRPWFTAGLYPFKIPSGLKAGTRIRDGR